jgi:superfamily II DNA or RNA helicase
VATEQKRLTPYHAAFFAYDLTKRAATGSVERLTSALADAQVDLNPHQIDAAIFATRNPLARGAILADEVGLGKTIEAGLLLSQCWAERRRRLLVIVPANLRKQWAQELADKFHLPSTILETKTFNQAVRAGRFNPFECDDVVICSYQFARSKDAYLSRTPWDLIVIDEAHRLRNVYKPQNKIAQTIRAAIAPYRKVLLTATPLQNSLLELFGLVSILDEHVFGDLQSFRAQFVRPGLEEFTALKERLATICKRTLRRQVLEYVSYTNRHAIVQEFAPSDDEQRLYDLVSEYLQRPKLYALPASQRQLMTLILRKLLASSTYAISGTLEGLVQRLETKMAASDGSKTSEMVPEADYETFDELADEWEDDEGVRGNGESLSPEDLAQMRLETTNLRDFASLARSIVQNSKGQVLLTALRRGFKAATDAQKKQRSANLQQKAVVFTESRRTQDYLFRILQETEFKDQIVLFNGTNNDPLSKELYQRWLERHRGTDKISGSPTADLRAAIIEAFRDHAAIMIATEAAAEGINLQFCNLVVNYDMPWNPQRVEQRIGRCHRYGQKFDVVVVNFVNKENAADVRVYELLDEKFKLFSGVFGASDEVLGAVESGVDFEKRIAAIYQRCRTPQQIEFQFDQLRTELEDEISGVQSATREKLLDNFDQEVVEKVRVQSKDSLDRFNALLWALTRSVLADFADFDERRFAFSLRENPFVGETIHAGPYRLGRDVDDANTYRIGHPLAQRVLARAKDASLPPAIVRFDLSRAGKKITILEPLNAKSGWLTLRCVALSALDEEEELIFAGLSDDGITLDSEQCRRLFDLDASVGDSTSVPPDRATALTVLSGHASGLVTAAASKRNAGWFEGEIDKLDRWADDMRKSLKAELDDAEDGLKASRRAARTAQTLPEKLALQRDVHKYEAKRDDAWRNYDKGGREVDARKEGLLDDVAQRLSQTTSERELFTIRWILT